MNEDLYLELSLFNIDYISNSLMGIGKLLNMKFLFDLFPVVLFFIFYKIYDIYVATAVLMAATYSQIVLLYLFKKKIEKTKIIQSLRERKFFTKPSVVKRTQNLKAKHKQKLQGEA